MVHENSMDMANTQNDEDKGNDWQGVRKSGWLDEGLVDWLVG